MKPNYYIKNKSSKFIEIWGDDRQNFLQGLITNDILKFKNNKNCLYSCFLSPQGKFIADFFIVYFKDYYLIEIDTKFFSTFCSKLHLYKLRSKVEIKENNKFLSFITFADNFDKYNKDIISFKDPRNENLGIKVYLSNELDISKFIKMFKKNNFDEYKKILMKNLVPNSVTDLIENKSLLLENNFQNINAIDWNKGCYVGQEITARMKYRSLLKKKIYVLEILSGKINEGDGLKLNDLLIGNVISKIDKYILCMLKISLVDDLMKNTKEIQIKPNTLLKFL